MLKVEEIFRAKQRIESYIIQSPLIYSACLSRKSGAEVYLKLESLQPTRSFKVRGALNKLLTLAEEDRDRPLVVASAGNHGLGVAYAADRLGFKNVTIFVPDNCPISKLSKFAYFAVQVKSIGKNYDEAVEYARAYLSKTDGLWIPAYDDLEVIAGQGTIGIEILNQLTEVDLIIVPVGGGGMIAGIATAMSELTPEVEVVGIQPAASPSAVRSFQAGEAIDPFDHDPTIADGLAGGFGKVPFRVARDLISKILLASEDEIRKAIVQLLISDQVLAEPSGAIAVVPLLGANLDAAGKKIVCVISGGNLSHELLRELIS